MTLSSAARHVAAVTTAGTILIVLASPAAAQTYAGHLAVRLYDFSALDESVRSAALDEARAIIANAGVNANWHDCYRTEGCAPEAGELVIRVIRETSDHGFRRAAFGIHQSRRGLGTPRWIGSSVAA